MIAPGVNLMGCMTGLALVVALAAGFGLPVTTTMMLTMLLIGFAVFRI